MRPGELVQLWIEERLDAERRGGGATSQPSTVAFDELSRRLDELSRRVDQLSSRAASAPSPAQPTPAAATAASSARKRATSNGRRTRVSAAPKVKRVALHEEIAAVIGQDGPMSAADLARAISKRGRYSAPRSDRPLDAATVNSRVSNPVYRSRFRRENGKIGLA